MRHIVQESRVPHKFWIGRKLGNALDTATTLQLTSSIRLHLVPLKSYGHTYIEIRRSGLWKFAQDDAVLTPERLWKRSQRSNKRTLLIQTKFRESGPRWVVTVSLFFNGSALVVQGMLVCWSLEIAASLRDWDHMVELSEKAGPGKPTPSTLSSSLLRDPSILSWWTKPAYYKHPAAFRSISRKPLIRGKQFSHWYLVGQGNLMSRKSKLAPSGRDCSGPYLVDLLSLPLCFSWCSTNTF
jgi:hypothetical protein